MEYTNELLQEMQNRQKYNRQYAVWFKKYAKEQGVVLQKIIDSYTGELRILPDKEKSPPETIPLYNKGINIELCLDVWDWNVYHETKIMDLLHVNRCKNARFCPNCKVLETSKYIHKITPVYKDMLDKGYHFYFLTLTIPSVKAENDFTLKNTVQKLYKDFSSFKNYYSRDITSKDAFAQRSVDFAGGIRVLEITYNDKAGYHPHLHCIIVTEHPIDTTLLEPKYRGKYRRKSKEYIYKSELECEIAKVWTLIHYNRFSNNNYDNYDYDPKETYATLHGVLCDEENGNIKNLEVDFRELDPKGFKETFKYTVKSSEIKSYKIFKQMYNALFRRRIRQGFGVLYNLKVDDCMDDVGELQELPSECEGLTPERLLTVRLKDLYTVYADYKKISRFSPDEEKDLYFKIHD